MIRFQGARAGMLDGTVIESSQFRASAAARCFGMHAERSGGEKP